MSVAGSIRRQVRRLLEKRGYWVRRTSVLPYGIDYQLDIDRLSRILRLPVEVFFDVGANIGQTSKAALAKFSDARIFAFEPDETTFATLTTVVVAPRFHGFNIALSNTSGEAQFYDYGPHATSNSLVANSQFAARTQNPASIRTVKCETLDDVCARLDIGRIDVLKVDAEGHDLAVLQGASRMLAEHRIRFIYIEFNTLRPREGTSGGALLPIGELLEPAGFKFIASYPEYMITTGEFFVTSNALFLHR